MYSYKNLYMTVDSTLFITDKKNQKKLKCLPTDDKQNVIYPYSVILFSHKKECTDTCYSGPWMDLDIIILSERSQAPEATYLRLHSYEKYMLGKTLQTESRLMAARGWGKGGMGSDC